MSSVLKKIKQSSKDYQNAGNEMKKNKKRAVNKRNIGILVLCFLVLIAVVVTFYFILFKDDEPVAMEFYINENQVTGSASRELLSICIADTKYQIGSDFAEEDIHFLSMETLSTFLRAEHLCDNVYRIGLLDEQKQKVEDTVKKCIDKYGSEREFEKHLKKYGTDIDAFRRYLELGFKQSNVLFLIDVTDEEMQEYFASNFAVVDMVTVTATDDETKKKVYETCEKIKSGEMTMNDAKAVYGGYENRVYYNSRENEENIPRKLYDKIWSMKTGEVDIVEIEKNCYIIEKLESSLARLKQNGGLYETIEKIVKEKKFALECETLKDYIHVNEDVANRVLPNDIPPLNIRALSEG